MESTGRASTKLVSTPNDALVLRVSVGEKGSEMNVNDFLVVFAMIWLSVSMYLDRRTIKYQRKTIDMMRERIDLLFECQKVNADTLRQLIDAAGKDTK
jgi:hypothetical protein